MRYLSTYLVGHYHRALRWQGVWTSRLVGGPVDTVTSHATRGGGHTAIEHPIMSDRNGNNRVLLLIGLKIDCFAWTRWLLRAFGACIYFVGVCKPCEECYPEEKRESRTHFAEKPGKGSLCDSRELVEKWISLTPALADSLYSILYSKGLTVILPHGTNYLDLERMIKSTWSILAASCTLS